MRAASEAGQLPKHKKWAKRSTAVTEVGDPGPGTLRTGDFELHFQCGTHTGGPGLVRDGSMSRVTMGIATVRALVILRATSRGPPSSVLTGTPVSFKVAWHGIPVFLVSAVLKLNSREINGKPGTSLCTELAGVGVDQARVERVRRDRAAALRVLLVQDLGAHTSHNQHLR